MELARLISTTRKNIKKKFNALQASRGHEAQDLERIFKPVTKPLENIAKIESMKTEPDFKYEKFEENDEEEDEDEVFRNLRFSSISPIPLSSEAAVPSSSTEAPEIQDFVKELKEDLTPLMQSYVDVLFKSSDHDTTYGVRIENDNLYLGTSEFKFLPNDELQIGNKKWRATEGLLELIIKKIPREGSYTKEDLRTYFKIIHLSRVIWKDDARTKLNSTVTHKYRFIIKDKFQNFMKKVRHCKDNGTCKKCQRQI